MFIAKYIVNQIESGGGFVSIDSELDKGTTISLIIPLTLAILEGMNFKVGNSTYLLPITAIRDSFMLKGSS
ncbi:MAG: hypothetical protein Q8942_15375 [Bacillota bacterium]|nr:hypothetical protein [Bacillota bacterium]